MTSLGGETVRQSDGVPIMSKGGIMRLDNLSNPSSKPLSKREYLKTISESNASDLFSTWSSHNHKSDPACCQRIEILREEYLCKIREAEGRS
jgi:hypothetical protein